MIRYAAATALLAFSQIAAAAQPGPCLTRPEVKALIAFATPSLIEAAAKKCTISLPPEAFLRTGAPSMAERLRAEAQAETGSVTPVIEKLAGEKMPAGLSEETTRSLMRDILIAELTKDIDPKDCGPIDVLTSSLSPLPAANIAAFMAAILEISGSGKKSPFRICED